MQSCRGGKYISPRRLAPLGLSGVVGGSRPVFSGEMMLKSERVARDGSHVMRTAWFQRIDESAPT